MMQTAIFRTLKVIIVLAICIRRVDGKLLVQPRNTVALIGHLTYFNCSTDEPDGKVQWLKDEEHIYAGDKILNFDSTRFSVELDNKTGSCNLVIRNVTIEDAGSYSCKDIKDIDDASVAVLSILDSGPLCQSNVKSDGLLGPNDCHIVPEVLNLSCSATYHGNTPPTLQWKSVNDHTPAIYNAEPCKIFTNDTLKGGKVACDMRVNAELYLHNSSFLCQTNSSANEQYSCSSGPIKILYAFDSFHIFEKTIDETAQCSANSTAQCNYKWLLNDTVINDGSLTVTSHRQGVYRCEAVCDMRGRQCSVTAMLVHVNTVNTGPETKTGAGPSTLAIVFIVLFVLSIVSICLLLYLLRSKSERLRIKEDNPELKTNVSNRSKMIGHDDGHPLLPNETDELRSETTSISNTTERSDLSLKNKELDDQQEELDDKQEELDDKQKELDDKQKELDDKQKELEDCKRELRKKNEELAKKNLEISDDLLLFGLSDGSNVTDKVLMINLQNPSEVYHGQEVPHHMNAEATAAVYQNTVYVVGLGTYADKICKYKSKSGWKECASMRQGRRRHSVAFVDEVLYICGGFVDTDKTVLDSVEAYNAVHDTCKAVGKLVTPVQNSGNCVAYKKSLYIFGGQNKDEKAISDVHVYDTVQNTCHLLSKTLPVPNRLMRAALWRESVILLGKWNCFIYDFSSEEWLVREKFQTRVIHFGLAQSNDRIYVIGGGTCTADADGKDTWTHRDDVRSVAIEEIIENKPVKWKEYAKLSKPCMVHAYAVVRELTA